VARARNRRRVEPGPKAPPGALRHGLTLAALWGLSAAALGVAGVAGWRYVTKGEALRIGSIRVVGATRAAASEIQALSPVKPGDDLLAADVDAVERAAARHPWVASAVVRRRLPPALEITVTEREPRALVDLGGTYLVDRDAQVFKRATAGDGLDLPVVTGFGRDDFTQRRAVVEARLRGALALLDEYAREGLVPLAAVQEIHLDDDWGVTLYVGDEGTQVRLGQGDLPQKLGRLHRVLEALRAEGRRAEVIHLDDRNHPDRVAVRLSGSGGVQDVAGGRPAPARVEGVREGPGRRRGRDAPLARR
jgi:cell division protein FtsQ